MKDWINIEDKKPLASETILGKFKDGKEYACIYLNDDTVIDLMGNDINLELEGWKKLRYNHIYW